MSSLWGDLTDFGAGLLDDVGEGMGNLIDAATTDTSQNAGTTQQPETPVKDNHGNTVTQPQGTVPAPKDNTLLYVGGGVAAVVVLFGLVLIAKK